MIEESPALIADREAARLAFIRDFRQHALDDAYNRATRQVSVRLRSAENLKMWAQTLDQLRREVTNAQARELIAAKVAECSALRMAESRIAAIVNQNKVQEARVDHSALVDAAFASVGFTQERHMTLNQVNAILLCRAISEIKTLRSELADIKANKPSQFPQIPQNHPDAP